MGQRQSSQQERQTEQQGNEQRQEQMNNNHNDQVSQTHERPQRNRASIRPPSRVQLQRDALRSAVIPLNENQRRDERRSRRERIREQQLNGGGNSTSEETAAGGERSLLSTVAAAMEAASTNTTNPSMSPFSRMIASVIGEAVITAFRNGHLPAAVPSTTTTTTTTENNDQNRNGNVRQQLTMHLSPELFQEMEPGSTEDSFMRFMRLPVIVTSVSTRAPPTTTETGETNNNAAGTTTTTTTTTAAAATLTSTAVNADGQAPTLSTEESEVTRVIMLPVFLYGVRSSNNNNVATTTTAATTTTDSDGDTTMAQGDSNATATATRTTTDDDTTQPIRRRRSARVLAQQQRATATEQAQPPTPATPTTPDGQWTVYIISGNHVGDIMNDRPSYEELLELAALIGPARQATVSQEAIDNHVPLVKYTQQVKQTILGNSDGCQVCLNSYQSQDDVRVLDCHHGFHKDCIDRWLTQGQNRCPLCRDVPIPNSNDSSST